MDRFKRAFRRDSNDIPTKFLCPVSKTMYVEPVKVRATCEHTISLHVFEDWIGQGHKSCPVCEQPLKALYAKSDRELAESLAAYRESPGGRRRNSKNKEVPGDLGCVVIPTNDANKGIEEESNDLSGKWPGKPPSQKGLQRKVSVNSAASNNSKNGSASFTRKSSSGMLQDTVRRLSSKDKIPQVRVVTFDN